MNIERANKATRAVQKALVGRFSEITVLSVV